MNTYTGDVYREGRYWVIDLPEIDQRTQVRNEGEIEEMARGCVAITLDVPFDSFELVLKRHPLGVEVPD